MMRLRSFNRFILIGLTLLGLSVSPANAATYDLAGGFGSELQGANGVVVNGLTYNVEFLDGTCISVYSGCNEASDFAFNTPTAADAASQALIEQVFGNDDVYDSRPELTRGIVDTTQGQIATPWTGDASALAVRFDTMSNSFTDIPDTNDCFGIGTCVALAIFNTTNSDGTAWARWTQVSAVPVPAAVWLFGTALIGLVGFGKRKARMAA